MLRGATRSHADRAGGTRRTRGRLESAYPTELRACGRANQGDVGAGVERALMTEGSAAATDGTLVRRGRRRRRRTGTRRPAAPPVPPGRYAIGVGRPAIPRVGARRPR